MYTVHSFYGSQERILTDSIQQSGIPTEIFGLLLQKKGTNKSGVLLLSI